MEGGGMNREDTDRILEIVPSIPPGGWSLRNLVDRSRRCTPAGLPGTRMCTLDFVVPRAVRIRGEVDGAKDAHRFA